MDAQLQKAHVAEYYGKTLQATTDLRTSACCPVGTVPKAHVSLLAQLHPEVTSRFYGCGSPIPPVLTGATVLDLGCGTGRDAFLASALVGPTGSVIGVDMTPDQLAVARKHLTYHADKFLGAGIKSNISFREGVIEDLSSASITDKSVDVVISNCVCNLSPNKRKVFSEVFRVLAPGGEFFFSDVYADRRLTAKAASHPVLIGECLGGALYMQDFRRIMADVGFHDVRVVSTAPITVNDDELQPLVEDVSFYSVTIRAFKVPSVDDRQEDYGQTATYRPSTVSPDIDGIGEEFQFDVDHKFPAGVAVPIDSNSAEIIEKSRFGKLFSISPAGTHKGLFKRRSNVQRLDATFDCFRPAVASLQSANGTASKGGSCCGPSKKTAKVANEQSSCGPLTKPNTTNGVSCCAPVKKQVSPNGKSCAPSKKASGTESGSCASSGVVAAVSKARNESAPSCCAPSKVPSECAGDVAEQK